MGVTEDPADNIKHRFFMAEDAETSAQSPLHEAEAAHYRISYIFKSKTHWLIKSVNSGCLKVLRNGR